jgi:hypothetical protein
MCSADGCCTWKLAWCVSCAQVPAQAQVLVLSYVVTVTCTCTCMLGGTDADTCPDTWSDSDAQDRLNHAPY